MFAEVLVHCVKTVTGIWKYIVERETVYTWVLLKLVLMLNKARLRLQVNESCCLAHYLRYKKVS